jgi:hypothetical protein
MPDDEEENFSDTIDHDKTHRFRTGKSGGQIDITP